MSDEKLIHEPATETAKKVRRALKEIFTSCKFSVVSESYSFHSTVTIYFKSGPVPDAEEMQNVWRRFASSTFDAMTDFSDVNGYEYEGKKYYGADYVRFSGPRREV